jgi:hypothetical protein
VRILPLTGWIFQKKKKKEKKSKTFDFDSVTLVATDFSFGFVCLSVVFVSSSSLTGRRPMLCLPCGGLLLYQTGAKA